MIRARFYLRGTTDYRPISWPIKHPYWCTGFEDADSEDAPGNPILVAYADSDDAILQLWPEAERIESEEVEGYHFTSRFPRPDWLKEEVSDGPPADPKVGRLLGPADLEAAGRLLAGTYWQRELARLLPADERLVRRWTAKDPERRRPIPGWVWVRLAAILEERARMIAAYLPGLQGGTAALPRLDHFEAAHMADARRRKEEG